MLTGQEWRERPLIFASPQLNAKYLVIRGTYYVHKRQADLPDFSLI
jgi:hypothetical protein